MALRVVVREGGAPREDGAPELGLTFDTPRLVIGRGEGCDLRLPDPSVSHRHASIRQRGTEYIVVDEKSTNGTLLGKVALSPHSPRVVRSGELVRVGRVWLEIKVELGVPPFANAAAARQLALELVTRGLAAQGEEGRPRLVVREGPDAGKTLVLGEPGRRYIVGRGKDADLMLDDADASRRHVDVAAQGDGVVVHDLGSQAGSVLGEAPLGQADVAWKAGQVLQIGAARIALEHPAADALAELERSPDERLRPGEEIPAPAEPEPEPSAEPAEPEAATARPASKRPAPLASPVDEGGWSFTDGAVVLMALGVLAISIAGLIWLLKG